MKIIFLDFDGVLNFSGFLEERENIHAIDPVCVHRLNRIIDATDAQVVVSSTWRIFFNNQQLREILRDAGFKGQLIDTTIDLGGHRGDEIRHWLNNHLGVTSFVILDDNDDGISDHFKDQWVETSFVTGLLKVHVEKAINILNG